MGLALIVPGLDFSGANLGRVTLVEDKPVTAIAITGASTVVGSAEAEQYLVSYTPSDTTERSVTWSIASGSTYASINSSGMLSVLAGASGNSVTIRATSQANPSIYAEKTITVTYFADSLPEGAIACELIYTDGYSVFIESGITPGTTMSYELTAFWVKPSTGTADAFGSFINSKRYIPFRFDNLKPEVCYNGWYYLEETAWPKIEYLKSKGILTPTGAHIEHYDWEDTLVKSFDKTYDQSSFTPIDSLALLGLKTSSTSIGEGSFRGGIQRLKMYSDDHYGTLVADFRACYYNGNFGFWESVSQSFKVGSTPAGVYGIGQHWDTDGFMPNVINHQANTGYITDNRTTTVTRMFALPSGCANIRFNAGTVVNSMHSIDFYNLSKSYIDYFSYNTADRQITVPNNAAYLRMSFTSSLIDDCYIYDITHSQYIWKGKNVQ